MKIRLSESGFTIVEKIILIAIVGLLFGIAIPNFGRAYKESERRACLANLERIESVKDAFVRDNALSNQHPILLRADLMKSSRGVANRYFSDPLPVCPAGGTYIIGEIGQKPTCSILEHAL